MRLIDADKLKQHYAWWNDENKELFDTIVDIQPTIEPEEAKRGKWLMCMKTGRLELPRAVIKRVKFWEGRLQIFRRKN